MYASGEARGRVEEDAPGTPKDVVLAEELLGHLRRMERLKPDGARSADEVQALAKGEAPLGFEAWAELSLGFLGAPLQEKLEALGARKLTLEEWAAIDDDYLRGERFAERAAPALA